MAVRVLMARMSPLLRDLLGEMFDAEGDIEVVTSLQHDAELAAEVVRTHADVLLVQLGQLGEPTDCLALLGRLPHLKVLALSPTATGATLYELRPARGLVGEVTSERLLGVVRRSTLPMPAGRISTEAELEVDLSFRAEGAERGRVRIAPPWEARP